MTKNVWMPSSEVSLTSSHGKSLGSSMACVAWVSGIPKNGKGQDIYLLPMSSHFSMCTCVGEVLLALEEGVDVYDTSLPYLASEQGLAFVAQWKITDGMARISSPNGLETIDLQQEDYTSDFRPLLPGCSCPTCSYHSRAYLHHLLETRELLAKVLLMT